MQTKQTLRPGERGTRKLTEHFGDRPLCARYRKDPETGRRFKTAEIIVEVALPVPAAADQDPHELLSLDVAYHEIDVRETVKAAGVRWDNENRIWKRPRYRVHKLQLESRIVNL